MSQRDPIAQYLVKLRALLKIRLWAHPACRRRILEDIHDHLEDAANHHEANGLSRAGAERRAIEDFGAAEQLAGQFVTEVRHARRTMLARVAPLVVLAMAGSLVATTFGAREASVPIAPFTADCGSNEGGNAESASDGGEGRLEGQRIVVAGVWSATERQKFARVLERFKQKTGSEASVSYESRPPNIAPKLEVRLNSGCPPDVALLPQPGLLRKLARAGQLKPIEAVAGDLVDRNYSPEWRRLGSFDHRLYGVWFQAANKSTFWYSSAAFRDAGVSRRPETWEELQKVANRLRARGVVPFSVAGSDGWTLTDWFENVYLRAAGPSMYKKLAEHEIPWTDPSVKHALRTLAEIFGKQQWLAGDVAGTLETDFEESVHQVFTNPPQAAMVYEGDFVPSAIAARTGAKVGHDADFFPFPSVDGSEHARALGVGEDRVGIVAGGDVAVLFTDQPAAKELIRFLAKPQAAEPWAKAGGFVSPNKRLAADAYADATTRRSARALVRARTISFDLSDQQPPAFGATDGQGMWQILRDYLRSPDDVDAVTQRLEKAVTAVETCERAVQGQC